MIGSAAVELINLSPIGTRLVVRYRLDDGATDALGYLRDRDAETCTIETRRGLSVVLLAEVIAAKGVPAPPAPRRPRLS